MSNLPTTSDSANRSADSAELFCNWKAVYIGCGDWDLDGPVTEKDWTLAAAAPELLEALQAAMQWGAPFKDAPIDARPDWFNLANIAIKKATVITC